MNRSVVYTATARPDVTAAADWYEARRAGDGPAFRTAIDACVADLIRMPLLYAVVADDVRAAPVGRVPYPLYYRVTPARITVVAVRHTARGPANGPAGNGAS